MPHLYILECADSTFYVGSTNNLVKRLWEHENGVGANFTSKRLPVKLVYCEEYGSAADAFEREKQIQGWSHAKKAALIAGNLGDMHKLAECRNESHWVLGSGQWPMVSARPTLASATLSQREKGKKQVNRTSGESSSSS